MPFPDSVRIQALVRSRRHCCVCHEFAGRASNVHHIVQEAKGGTNTLENAICLCQRCHTEAGHYNSMHPLGTKYSPEELRAHRDAWCNGPLLKEPSDDKAGVMDAFALGILEKLDDPSLAVLSALARVPESASVDFAKDPVPNVNLVSLPSPQLVPGEFDWNSPQVRGLKIDWPWLVLETAVLGLRQQRLLHFHSAHARGGYGNIYLSQLGQAVVACTAFPSRNE